MKIGVAQIDLTNDVSKNTEKIVGFIDRAEEQGIEIIAFPETALTGYIYDDFLSVAQEKIDAAVTDIRNRIDKTDLCVIAGTPYRCKDVMYNGAVIITGDGATSLCYKRELTSYEHRYFKAGRDGMVFTHNGGTFGVMICRDQNNPEIAMDLKKRGAGVIFICSAHYYALSESKLKLEKNVALPVARAYENNVYVCKANTVGTSMGRISFGNSLIVHPNGIVIRRGNDRTEELLFCEAELDRENEQW